MTRDESLVVDGDPTVVYVPGAHNRYVPHAETVVLDSALREYPLAHDAILQHELMHHKIGDERLSLFAWHEFREDLRHYVLRDETSREIREYYGECDARPTRATVAVRLLRPIWGVPFASFGVLRHTVLDICEDIREEIRERVEIDAEEIEI